MAQSDLTIQNQSFPSFRADLNDALTALNTTQSGTSTPASAVAGTIWLDLSTGATTPTLKYYDGADNISLATIDHVGNTVNWLDSTVSVTGLSTTATGTVLTLTDSVTTSSVNLIIDNQKEIRFNETTANGANYVALKAPASLTTDTTFVLPSADGTAGQFLKTDGSGNLSFDSLSFSTPLAVIGNATAGAEIRLPEDTDNGSNYVALKAPDTLASDLTLTLPSSDGTSGQVLQTNGSGVLSFATPSGGKVLASYTATDSTIRTTTSGSFNTASSTLSITVTPASASSKFLVTLTTGKFELDRRGNYTIMRNGTSLLGDPTIIRRSDTNNELVLPFTLHVLDSPNTTSSVTYAIGASVTVIATNFQTFFNVTYEGGSAEGNLTVIEIDGN